MAKRRNLGLSRNTTVVQVVAPPTRQPGRRPRNRRRMNGNSQGNGIVSRVVGTTLPATLAGQMRGLNPVIVYLAGTVAGDGKINFFVNGDSNKPRSLGAAFLKLFPLGHLVAVEIRSQINNPAGRFTIAAGGGNLFAPWQYAHYPHNTGRKQDVVWAVGRSVVEFAQSLDTATIHLTGEVVIELRVWCRQPRVTGGGFGGGFTMNPNTPMDWDNVMISSAPLPSGSTTPLPSSGGQQVNNPTP